MAFLEFLRPDVVFVCAVLVTFCFFMALAGNRLLFYCLAIPLFISCFGKYRYITQAFAYPMEWMFLNSRAIYVLLMSSILAISWIVLKKQCRLHWHPANVFFLLLQYVYAVRMILIGAEGFGAVTVTVFTLNILVIVVLRSILPADPDKATRTFAEMIAIAGMLFTTASVYQFIADRSNSFWAGRFIGITNNSIHTGEFCVWFVLATIAVLFGAKKRTWNIRSLALVGIILVQFLVIVATGSRTAMLMLLVSLLVMFRRRLGSLVLPFVLIGVAVAILVEYFDEFSVATSHLASGTDSRSGVFRYMFDRFLQNPLTGTVEILKDENRIQVRESSYISTAANLGILGLFPLIAMLVCYYREFSKAIFEFKQNRTPNIYHDWLHGMLFGTFVAALFEGFMFQIVGIAPFLIHFGLLLLYNKEPSKRSVARSSTMVRPPSQESNGAASVQKTTKSLADHPAPAPISNPSERTL